MEKKAILEAVQYAFGMTKKDAVRYIKNATPEAIAELVTEYNEAARKSFYND